MIAKSIIFVVVAATLGAVLGLATSSGERGEAFRQFVSAQLTPIGRLVNAHRDGELLSTPGEAVQSETPYFVNFFNQGKPDPDLKDCEQLAKPENSPMFVEKMAAFPQHHTVATVIACLLDHDWPRFCRPGGREQIVAAEEIYFWARHRAADDEKRVKAERQYYDESQRKAFHDLNGDHYDPDALSWDGPQDHAIVDSLKQLARQGYVSLRDFGLFPRDEIRAALDGVAVEKNACGQT